MTQPVPVNSSCQASAFLMSVLSFAGSLLGQVSLEEQTLSSVGDQRCEGPSPLLAMPWAAQSMPIDSVDVWLVICSSH